MDRPPRPLARGVRGRPRRDLVAELRRVGARAVRHRQDRRDPGQRQPGVPDPRAGLRPQPGRHLAAGRAPQPSRPATTGRWSTRSAATARRWAASCSATPKWDDAPERRRRRRRRALAEAQAGLEPGDAINIQYTSGTTGFPKGATLTHRNILNNGYFIGEGCRYTEADRVCIPVPFYHCFGMVHGQPRLPPPRRVHGHPGTRLRPGARRCRRCSSERCTSLYGVPTMFIAELVTALSSPTHDLSTLRTGIMAGSPCPVEVMKQVIDDGHDRGDHLLRHDRDLARVHPDQRRRRPRGEGRHRRPGRSRTSRSRSSTRRPATTVPRGEPGEFCTGATP